MQEDEAIEITIQDVVPVATEILSLEDWTEYGDYQQTQANVAGQVKESSARVYRSEARLFALWLHERHFSELTREVVIAYHQYLRGYKPNTAARKWAIVKQIVGEHIIRHDLSDFARGIKGYKKGKSTKHIALTKDEVRLLLDLPDKTSKMGLRDLALLRTMLRLALRRGEAAGLTVGSMGMNSGHHTLSVWGKGTKFRVIKLPVDVWRMLVDYQEAIGNAFVPVSESGERCYESLKWNVSDDHPLFVGFDKGDRPTHQGIVGDTVYRLVRTYGKQAGIVKLTAHSTRATTITLMLEEDVPLWKVAELAGHSDTRSTLVYKKRRDQLDESAADVLHF